MGLELGWTTVDWAWNKYVYIWSDGCCCVCYVVAQIHIDEVKQICIQYGLAYAFTYVLPN